MGFECFGGWAWDGGGLLAVLWMLEGRLGGQGALGEGGGADGRGVRELERMSGMAGGRSGWQIGPALAAGRVLGGFGAGLLAIWL